MNTDDRNRLSMMLAVEASKARKLEIIFGPWWRHYALPYEFSATLFTERSECPYCNAPLSNFTYLDQEITAESVAAAHLDHMDPLSRGGEESIRNAVYVCRNCNLAKGGRLFIDWLASLDPIKQQHVRQVYEEKHDHMPEDFSPGPKQSRLTSRRYELGLDENVLGVLFRKPLVSGPPTCS